MPYLTWDSGVVPNVDTYIHLYLQFGQNPKRKVERRKEKKHGGYVKCMLRPDIFVLQQYFLHAVADAVFLSRCVPECLTARTASFWSRRRTKQTRWLPVVLEAFSPR